jgi:hypothetical protein
MQRSVGILLLSVALGCGSCDRNAESTKHRRDSDVTEGATPAAVTLSALRDGDLIFHESTSRQSEMVRALTKSRWTHVGVVFKEQGETFVFEAVSPVKRTPLQSFAARGRDGHYVIKRLRDAENKLTPERIAKLRQVGSSWLGRPYDLRFRWDDQSLYCSELVYKLFERGAGIRLGELERAEDMNLDDERVQRALRKRFAGAKFDPDETVVTPDSIFNDEQLVEVEL